MKISIMYKEFDNEIEKVECTIEKDKTLSIALEEKTKTVSETPEVKEATPVPKENETSEKVSNCSINFADTVNSVTGKTDKEGLKDLIQVLQKIYNQLP